MRTANEAMLIPDEAVVTDQAQRVVYVVGPGNRVVAKPVTLGPQSMGLRVVVGLLPTDRVIINGLARLQPDMEVDPQPGEIKPTPEPNAAVPGSTPTAPNGNPEQGTPPGTGANAQPGGDPRGRAPGAVDPQKK
jgi:hypothetical protein